MAYLGIKNKPINELEKVYELSKPSLTANGEIRMKKSKRMMKHRRKNKNTKLNSCMTTNQVKSSKCHKSNLLGYNLYDIIWYHMVL